MWNRKQLKANAKVAFKRNYWKCVLVALLLGLATGAVSSGTSAYNTYNETQYIMSDEYYDEDMSDYLTEEEFYEYEEAEDVLDDVIPGGLGEAASSIFTTITLAVVLIIYIIVFVLSVFVFGPLEIGCCNFFKNNAYEKAELNKITVAFKKNHYWKMVGTVFLRNLFTTLWSFLFLIPGIIKAYEYRMITYILTDCPDMSRKDAFRISKEMMRGNKWNAFVLDISFLGWSLLAAITCGIAGIFYVSPYIAATDAELFIAIREEYFNNQRG